jgi:hypothetical protein
LNTNRRRPLVRSVICVLSGCLIFLATCACNATRGEDFGGTALPEAKARPLFDELAETDNQKWQCRTDSREFEFMNENCYVDLCRGNFDASGDIKGRGTYKGVLPQRLPDPNNPSSPLPTADPLSIEITFSECEGKACTEPLKIAIKNDGTAVDPTGVTYVCAVTLL